MFTVTGRCRYGETPFSSDGRTVIWVDRLSGEVRLYETATGQLRKIHAAGGQKARPMSEDPFAAGWQDGSPDVVSLEAQSVIQYASGRGGVRVRPLFGIDKPITPGGSSSQASVSFCPKGTLTVLANSDGSILVFDTSRLLPWCRRPVRKLSEAHASLCWEGLRSSSAASGFAAVQALSADPEQAVALLAARLQPPGHDDKRIARLLAGLDSDRFIVRRKSEAELSRLGAGIEEHLRTALAGNPSLHARRTMENLLKAAQLGDERVPLLRALEVLEKCRTPASRALLDKLARQRSALWFRLEVESIRKRWPLD
jgi:hypothetical protein